MLGGLRKSCEMFRVDLGDQSGRLKDVQQHMAHGMNNLPSALDTRLVQKGQRNNLQEGLLGELCAALTNLTARLETYTQDNQRTNQRFSELKPRMGDMGDEVKDEFGKSIDSATIRFEARLAGETKVHSASPSVVVKGGAKSIVPPGLGFGVAIEILA